MVFALVPWFSLMFAGLVASVVLLLWGHRSGQFAEQERARYLPFRDDIVVAGQEGIPEPVEASGTVAREVYALVLIMAAAGMALIVALVLAVFNRYGG